MWSLDIKLSWILFILKFMDLHEITRKFLTQWYYLNDKSYMEICIGLLNQLSHSKCITNQLLKPRIKRHEIDQKYKIKKIHISSCQLVDQTFFSYGHQFCKYSWKLFLPLNNWSCRFHEDICFEFEVPRPTKRVSIEVLASMSCTMPMPYQ